MSELPRYLAWTDRWAVRATAVVYCLLVLSNLLVNRLDKWLPTFVAGLILGPLTYWDTESSQ